MRAITVFLLFLHFHSAFAKLQIPTNLTDQNKNSILEILGLGTAPKVLGDPFPLGGYSGVEMGISTEIITTLAISKMGGQAATQEQTNIFSLHFGKGIYGNIDTFFHFSYLGQGENVSSFGTQIRWGFYQAQHLPIYSSFILSGSNTNFDNLIAISNQALDLIFGFKSGDITLFFGGGLVRVQGAFSGGTGGITSSGNTERSSLSDMRFIAGLNIRFEELFLAFELDRFTDPVYSSKLGFRF